ncbi:dioxygenase family protein [Chitinibacteraceae bacterium HSL-7]
MLPTLFIGHGSPTLLTDTVPARDFLRSLASRLPAPRAIVVVSAHHQRRQAAVGASDRWQEWHDFGGFPAELYERRYRPPGDPELARELFEALGSEGIDAMLEDTGRIDHGAWVPLSLAWPDASVPIVPVSLLHDGDSADHIELGLALAEALPDDVLLIGSGSLTHNLREAFQSAIDSAPPPYVLLFADWAQRACTQALPGQWLEWDTHAPSARRAHPSDEHLMPLLVARAAAGAEAKVECWHDSVTFGVLSMRALAFWPQT